LPRTDRPSRESPSLTSIGFLLHLARSRLGEGVFQAIEGSGLHPGHLGVLGALMDRGAMSQRRLSELTQIEKSSMVLFLDALEAGGWVRRAPDPADRRAHLVELTPEGLTKFTALGEKLQAAQDAFLAPLSPEEQTVFAGLLARLAVGGEIEDQDRS
jgi:DNA-binding MarR family transcriptional regulator